MIALDSTIADGSPRLRLRRRPHAHTVRRSDDHPACTGSRLVGSDLSDRRPLAPQQARRAHRRYLRRGNPSRSCSSPCFARQTLKRSASLGKGCSVELVPELYAASEQELLEQLQALIRRQ